MRRYIFYLGRWQLSGVVLAPILYLMTGVNPIDSIWATVIANLVGGAVFFWVDRIIFKEKK